ncbi:MAG: FMN-binding protein [Lentisphaeria bacterium]|nr:FMN-binding protein [Lentisphaeria bacterium]MBO5765368.1 FMN-binding protein [Lentisphaeria bacterium]MBO7153390.1 FMN-binding protein [Lentisphaeria bacterium]
MKGIGKTLAEAEKLKVDAVTGATYTSEAVKSEVKAVVSK